MEIQRLKSESSFFMEEIMISNFTTEQITKIIYKKLEPLKYKIVLSNPTTESEFPAIVIDTPLESTTKKYNQEILEKRFQVSIECWADKKYKVMQMMEETSQILIKYNFIKTNTTPDIFDEITQKYRMIMTFEVKHNGLTNSFI